MSKVRGSRRWCLLKPYFRQETLCVSEETNKSCLVHSVKLINMRNNYTCVWFNTVWYACILFLFSMVAWLLTIPHAVPESCFFLWIKTILSYNLYRFQVVILPVVSTFTKVLFPAIRTFLFKMPHYFEIHRTNMKNLSKKVTTTISKYEKSILRGDRSHYGNGDGHFLLRNFHNSTVEFKIVRYFEQKKISFKPKLFGVILLACFVPLV